MQLVAAWSGVEPSRQKLIGKGRLNLHKTPNASLKDLGLAQGASHTLMLLGTSSARAATLATVRDAAREEAAAIEERRSRAEKYTVRYRDRKVAQRQSKYRFQSVNPIDGLPDRDKAAALLARLAEDPGVVAVLEVRDSPTEHRSVLHSHGGLCAEVQVDNPTFVRAVPER